MILDAKVYGLVYKVKDNTLIPPDEWILFQAKDNAFYEMFMHPEHGYLATCRKQGADAQQLLAVNNLMVRLCLWRAENKERCKVPDAAGEKLNEGIL